MENKQRKIFTILRFLFIIIAVLLLHNNFVKKACAGGSKVSGHIFTVYDGAKIYLEGVNVKWDDHRTNGYRNIKSGSLMGEATYSDGRVEDVDCRHVYIGNESCNVTEGKTIDERDNIIYYFPRLSGWGCCHSTSVFTVSFPEGYSGLPNDLSPAQGEWKQHEWTETDVYNSNEFVIDFEWIAPTPTPVWQAEKGIPTTAPQAESPTIVEGSTYTWMCLHAEETENTGVNNREVALSAQSVPLDKDIYIVGCIEVDGEFKCTTGNNRASNIGLSQNIPGYDFAVSGDNPIVITESLELLSPGHPVIVTSKSDDITSHVFYAVYELEDPSQTGQGSTLQYATFAWNKDYSKCITIRWDPYGRVFDSKSLEPISEVTVTLLDKNKKKVSIPGLTNPLKTNKAGFFSFYVPDGDYFLKPIPPLSHSFSSSPQLNLNYTRAYSNLYAPDTIIRQRGTLVHADIPLDPGKNNPAITTPVSISFNILPDNNENTVKVIGQVSHPLTLVSIKQGDKEVVNTIADEFGYYEVEINNKDINANEPLTPVFTKVDLTQEEGQTTKILASNNILGISSENTYLAKVIGFFSLLFGQDKTSQDAPSVAGESIYIPPESLKGYIYDKTGNVIKNTQIDIILSMSDKVYNTITSDDNGYILVSNEYLPVFDYYLMIYPESQSSFKISMGEFLSGNK